MRRNSPLAEGTAPRQSAAGARHGSARSAQAVARGVGTGVARSVRPAGEPPAGARRSLPKRVTGAANEALFRGFFASPWKRFHTPNLQSVLMTESFPRCFIIQSLTESTKSVQSQKGRRRGASMTTIRDVAQLAQVSITTVSRALNGQAGVTAETRQRVLDAAARLSFTPSVAARSLITRRTNTVGLVLPGLPGEYLAELLRGADAAAHARGLHLLVACPPGGDRDLAATLRDFGGRVDGLLFMPPRGDVATFEVCTPAGMPLVLINAESSPTRTLVAVDSFGGAVAMTRHLIERGHRSIAFIAGPADDFDAQERLRGYRFALLDSGFDIEPIVVEGDFSEESGLHAGRRIAALQPRPAAVFAANDLMAAGCLSAFARAGLAVPRDIALAGFDDLPIARHLNPPLTTVRVPIAELGALAVDALVVDIEAGETRHPTRRTVPAQLVVRDSCASEAPVRTFARRSTDRAAP
jgi:LacI family transcriptional regulator